MICVVQMPDNRPNINFEYSIPYGCNRPEARVSIGVNRGMGSSVVFLIYNVHVTQSIQSIHINS